MNAQMADIHYLFMLDTGALLELMLGTEADYIASGGAATIVASIAPSGGMSGSVLNWDTVRREGRSVLSDDWKGFRAPVVVQTNGQSAALGFITDDFKGATALYLDPATKAVKTDDLFTWYGWSTVP
jgi:hypothetical protein